MSTDEARAVLWTEIRAMAKHLGKRAWDPVKHPSVIQLKEGATETPVYFIGSGLSELHLAQLMCSERSVFGVDIPLASSWRNAVAKQQSYALPTMEQLIAPYVAALSVHARSSPCVLVGHSFNGIIAFEAAHQLNQQGGKVEMVILIDSQLKYSTPHSVAWQNLQKEWKQLFNLRLTDRMLQSVASRLGSSWSIIRWMLVKEMKGLGQRLLATMIAVPAYYRCRQTRSFVEEVRWARWNLGVRDPDKLTTTFDENGVPWCFGLLWRFYENTLRSCRVRRLDCRGLVFRAEPESPADDSLGWDNLFSRGLEIIQVTGSHITVMQQPHITTLAREMSKVLNPSLPHRSTHPDRACPPAEARRAIIESGSAVV